MKITAILLVLLSFSLRAQIVASYNVVPLPSPGGFTSGINNAGQVPGIEYPILGSAGELFVSSPTGTFNIPLFSPPDYVYAINNAGQVVGNVGGGNQNFQAFIASTSENSLIPPSHGWTPFTAFGVNDSGQVAGFATNAGNLQMPYFGTSAGFTLIPLPAGWTSGIGTAINNNGQVAGFGNLPSGFVQSFLWTPSGGTTPIPLPSGAAFAMTYAVNDSGLVAGYIQSQNGQAFVGTPSGITLIPLPSGAPHLSSATVTYGSINNSGVVVGQLVPLTGTNTSGWIWDAAQGTISLSNLVPSGWSILNAVSISNTGLILAQASYNGGPTLWVELTSTPSTCSFSLTPPSLSVTAIGGTASFTVNTSPGCSWQASSSNTSLAAITSGGSGSGSGAVSVQFPLNSFTAPQTTIITVGTAILPVTQSAATLEPIGINHASGSGTTQTFQFTFADPQGYSDIKVMDILINNYLDGQNACYFAVVPSAQATSGYLYLVDDAGDGGYVSGTPMPIPSNGVVQNSQCSIDASQSFLLGDVGINQMEVTLSITFKSPFAGNKIIYTAVRGNAGNSGWQTMGTWNVPGATPPGPSVGFVSPGHTSTTGGVFSFTFTDSNGYQDLSVLDILTNSFLDGISACYLAYVPVSATDGYLYMVDDAGDGRYVNGSPMLLSSGGTLQNSQCTINAAQSSASASGNALTLNLAMSFSSNFSGNQVFYLAARNNSTGNSGWQSVGSVTVP
jgi:hypothetical protein